jgi:hypothetical protein
MRDSFKSLFKGLERAYGSFEKLDKKNCRAFTVKKPVTDVLFQRHLEGKIGLGIIPLNDDGVSFFGAIDIDDHKGSIKMKIEHDALARKIHGLGLPLVVCRSNSGGAHCYHFSEEGIPASEMRRVLLNFSKILGYKNIEIFPKQESLIKGGVGNWINLPYYGEERYAFGANGDVLSLEKFLCYADDMKKKEFAPSTTFSKSSLLEAPPCLEHLFNSGVSSGQRNDALFNFGVYLKKSSLNWEEGLNHINYSVLDPPLPMKEVKLLSKSLQKTDYRYKCGTQPICDLCDSSVCKQRKFGIEGDQVSMSNSVLFGSLIKIESSPPKYILDVSGENIIFTTEEILCFKKIKIKTFEKTNVLLPKMKESEWEELLAEKTKTMLIEDAPDDSGDNHNIIEFITEYLYLANGQFDKDLLQTSPAIFTRKTMSASDQYFVGFRVCNFENFLKQKKVPARPRSDLWPIFRSRGFSETKIRSQNTVISIWCAEIDPPADEDREKILI